METDACNSTKNLNGFLIDREICVASGEMEASNVSTLHGVWILNSMIKTDYLSIIVLCKTE